MLNGNFYGDAYAQVCLGRAISALSADATPLIPLLIKDQDTHLVHSITQNNAAAVALAWQEILKITEGPQFVAASEKWWQILQENKSLAFDPIFQLFCNENAEQDHPQLLAMAKTLLRQTLMQIIGQVHDQIPETIFAYLLNPANNPKVVAKKREILEMLVPMGYFSSSEGRKLLQQLLTTQAPEMVRFAEKLFFQRHFQEQNELDFFVTKFTPILNDLDLTKNIGWQQLREFQRLAQITFPPTGTSKLVALDYRSLEILVHTLLEKIALQVGYQTTTFSDLTNQLLKTELAPSLAHYFVHLMKDKQEQNLIVPYLLRIPDWDEEVTTTLAKYLQDAPMEQKKTILAILQHRQLFTQNTTLAPAAALNTLINIIFTLLTDTDDQIVNLAFQILTQAQAPLLPTILMRLKHPNIRNIEKLALLRLQWQISSTSEVGNSLEQALLQENNCNYHFVLGFSELLAKKADFGRSTSNKNQEISFHSSMYHYDETDHDDFTPVTGISPVLAIVYQKPSPLLIPKYVACPKDYLNPLTAKTLVNYSPTFRKIIESHCKTQKGDLQKFWQQILRKK